MRRVAGADDSYSPTCQSLAQQHVAEDEVRTSAVDRIIHPPKPINDALHEVTNGVLVQDVDSLDMDLQIPPGTRGVVHQLLRLLEPVLIGVGDGDAGAAFAGEGCGDCLADAYVSNVSA